MSTVDLEEIDGRLDAAEVGWLTTVTPSGQPQTSVVWFLHEGNELLVYTQPATTKVRNITANPRVAFTLQSDDRGDQVTTMEGAALVDAHPTPANEMPRYVEKYREPIARNGWTPASFAADYSALVTITVTRLRAF